MHILIVLDGFPLFYQFINRYDFLDDRKIYFIDIFGSQRFVNFFLSNHIFKFKVSIE